MKKLSVISAIFIFAVVSCKDTRSTNNSPIYSVQCKPTFQKDVDGTKLAANIEWELIRGSDLSYSAITFYREKDSSTLIRSLESHGGSKKTFDSSSSTVQSDILEEIIVLVTIFDEDKKVISREWYTSKNNG
jgi:hypothetical protein